MKQEYRHNPATRRKAYWLKLEREMLNFMSPWMTQYTREKHDGKKDPQRNMANRKPMTRSGRTPCTGARLARTIASLQQRVEDHPNDNMASARLAKLTAS